VSFEEFVQASSARPFRTALLLNGNDQAAAEDLLQLSLERAYRHWARVCRSGEPERYVRRILANASGACDELAGSAGLDEMVRRDLRLPGHGPLCLRPPARPERYVGCRSPESARAGVVVLKAD
jgi:hypothetical protein